MSGLRATTPGATDPRSLRKDHQFARELAEAAGALLLGIRSRLVEGAAPDDVRREGDRRSHELLVRLIRGRFPDDDVLSEEAKEDGGGTGSDRLWIIDPLDGTREFGEPGRDDWAVHIALVERGELTAGAVGLPARGVTYTTAPAPRPAACGRERIRIAVSRTRPAREAEHLARVMDAELVPMGSAGAKTMAVISGEADVYLHSGGQYVWDSAAPVAVARAAGLHASRIDGSPLVYGSNRTWLPDLVVCPPELQSLVLDGIKTLVA